MKPLLALLVSAASLHAQTLDGGSVLTPGKRIWDAGSVVEGPSFDIVVTPTQRVITPGSTSSGQDRDELYEITTGATIDHEAIITPQAELEQTYTFTNQTPDIATLGEGGQLTRVTDGTARVLVGNGYRYRLASATISRTTGATTQTFTGFDPGSFAHDVLTKVETMVSGKTAGAATQSMSTYNPSLWTGSLDISSIVVAASSGWPQGCLIAPRVVCFASHVGMQVGDVLTFRRHDTGGTQTATVQSISTSPGGDIRFALLTAEPGVGVTPAKLLPADMAAYWRATYGNRLRPDIPVLKMKRKGGLKLGVGVVQFRGTSSNTFGVSGPLPEALAPWYVEWIGGDSGSVVGLRNGDQFIFLGNAWTGPGSMDDGASYLPAWYSQMETILSGWGQSVSYATIVGETY